MARGLGSAWPGSGVPSCLTHSRKEQELAQGSTKDLSPSSKTQTIVQIEGNCWSCCCVCAHSSGALQHTWGCSRRANSLLSAASPPARSCPACQICTWGMCPPCPPWLTSCGSQRTMRRPTPGSGWFSSAAPWHRAQATLCSQDHSFQSPQGLVWCLLKDIFTQRGEKMTKCPERNSCGKCRSLCHALLCAQ